MLQLVASPSNRWPFIWPSQSPLLMHIKITDSLLTLKIQLCIDLEVKSVLSIFEKPSYINELMINPKFGNNKTLLLIQVKSHPLHNPQLMRCHLRILLIASNFHNEWPINLFPLVVDKCWILLKFQLYKYLSTLLTTTLWFTWLVKLITVWQLWSKIRAQKLSAVWFLGHSVTIHSFFLVNPSTYTALMYV